MPHGGRLCPRDRQAGRGVVTSGPGATNTITGIMTAHMDSVPMIVVSGQQVMWMLGKDAFQEADMFGITMPIVKHSYLLKNTNDIPRVVKEAFHIATTGRPGPVLIDMPKNVSSGSLHGGPGPEDGPARLQTASREAGRRRHPAHRRRR